MARLILTALRKQALLSVCLPLVGVFIISLAVSIFSTIFSYSLLLGGVIWFFPHGYVAIKLFHHIETTPKRFVASFYRSEIIKLILVAVLFILVVKWFSASFIGLLAGYMCAQVIFWIFFFTSR